MYYVIASYVVYSVSLLLLFIYILYRDIKVDDILRDLSCSLRDE